MNTENSLMNTEQTGFLPIGEGQPESYQGQKLKPQIPQMAQMGAGSTRMGPPEAASGPAGGQWGRRGRAFWGARAQAPPLKPMLEAAPLKTAIDSHFSICVNRWNLWTPALF